MITHRLLIEVIHHRIVTFGKEYNFWGRFEEKIRPPLFKNPLYISLGGGRIKRNGMSLLSCTVYQLIKNMETHFTWRYVSTWYFAEKKPTFHELIAASCSTAKILTARDQLLKLQRNSKLVHSASQAYVFYLPKYCSAVRANLSLSPVILKHLLNPVCGKKYFKSILRSLQHQLTSQEAVVLSCHTLSFSEATIVLVSDGKMRMTNETRGRGWREKRWRSWRMTQ